MGNRRHSAYRLSVTKTLFTAEAVSRGGRLGRIKTPDGLLEITARESEAHAGEDLAHAIVVQEQDNEIDLAAARRAVPSGRRTDNSRQINYDQECSGSS
jgi:hypothetical protein